MTAGYATPSQALAKPASMGSGRVFCVREIKIPLVPRAYIAAQLKSICHLDAKGVNIPESIGGHASRPKCSSSRRV